MTTATARTELPKSYVPGEHEPSVLSRWLDSGVFAASARPDDDRPPYCILIPPPNVTAALHLGHALNNTLQDVLVRHHRMRGFNALWMPGTDHAGIATQTVVEKRLMAQGRRRTDFTREAFVERVQAWKDEYEATITSQLKALGASCDWSRQRFTMDPICTEAVREAFFRLFRDGLIERGKRLVNWDPVTLTALADDEVEMREVKGSFWYLRYPLVDDAGRDSGEHVVVATTRPETMLGDTGVAVNPHDAARAHLAGRRVRLPIVDRIVPIVADDYVVVPDPESADVKARYASGFLKVTPAHDPNDWEIGRRHGLPAINVMAPDGSISDRHGWTDVSDEARALVGLSREAARAAVVAWFDAHGLLAETRPYEHSVGHSYRSHVPVEPYLSDQWYVRVTDDRLVGEAQRALDPAQFEGVAPTRPDGREDPHDGCLRFHPPRYARTYQTWHEGLRDWCISRQLWWGHRIPVWHSRPLSADEAAAALPTWTERARRAPGLIAVRTEETPEGTVVQVCLARDDESQIAALRDDPCCFAQDEDVLDTWFSSALWPLNTMGWPAPDAHAETAGLLDRFNPTSVLCTGRDIITLWVSRMVMFNRHFADGRVPFRHVYINPMIQDGHGQRMSKSLGNGVDPRDIIESHGADALRFVLVQMATGTQDLRLPVDMVSPFTGETFHPDETTSPAGYRVAAPMQTCPKTGRRMVSPYGAASGLALPDADTPVARNTSAKFDGGRNFCNKLWNAARFALGRIGDVPTEAPSGPRPLVERWILARLVETVAATERALAEYEFHRCAEAAYDFVWRDFCDWYLEAAKPTVGDDPAGRRVLAALLDAILRLLHPMCPFVTEALWPAVRGIAAGGIAGLALPDAPMLAGAAWPAPAAALRDDEALRTFARVQELVNAIRTERARHQVPPKRRIVLGAPAAVAELARTAGGVVETLAGVERIVAVDDARTAGAVPLTFEGAELVLSGLVESVDVDKERARLAALVADREKALAGFRNRLANEGYVRNAPPAVVEETRRRADETARELDAARAALAALPAEQGS